MLRRIPFSHKAQSFVELALVLVPLLILLAGVVEFGFLFARYLQLFDGVREATRLHSTDDPTATPLRPDCSDFYRCTAIDTLFFIRPATLDPSRGDDIVIYYVGVDGTTLTRSPDADGWSYYNNQGARISDAELSSRIDPAAPPTGILVIEVFYHYPQTLALPVISDLLPNPVPLHVYAMMPFPAGEPRP